MGDGSTHIDGDKFCRWAEQNCPRVFDGIHQWMIKMLLYRGHSSGTTPEVWRIVIWQSKSSSKLQWWYIFFNTQAFCILGGGTTPFFVLFSIVCFWVCVLFSKSWSYFRPKRCHFPLYPFSDLTSFIQQAHFRLLASLYVVCFAFIGISCHTMSYRTIWQPYIVKHRNPLDSVNNPSSLFPWQCTSDVQFKRSTDCKRRWKEIYGKGRCLLSCCLNLSTDDSVI